MVTKALTVLPLLVLSGFFFAADILEGGILFLVFAAVIVWIYARARAGASLSAEEMEQMELRGGPLPGAPRRGPDGGGSGA